MRCLLVIVRVLFRMKLRCQDEKGVTIIRGYDRYKVEGEGSGKQSILSRRHRAMIHHSV